MGFCASRLDSLREPDGVLAEVVDGVVLRNGRRGWGSIAVEEGTRGNGERRRNGEPHLPEEHISDDPNGPEWGGDVETSEGREASSLDLKDVAARDKRQG